MARNFTSYFETSDPASVGSGAVVTTSPEGSIQRNINWLQANMVRPLVWDVFGTAAHGDYGTYNNPWLNVSTGNDSSATVVANYRIRVPRDAATYRVHARVYNAHASAAGSFVVAVISNGATATVAIPAASTATVTVDVAVNTSQTRDTLAVGIQNGSSDSAGVCSLQSVLIYPVQLTSPLAAGVSTQGFVPIDGTEIAANAPMSTHLRNAMATSLDVLTTKRGASHLVTWSDNADERVAARHMIYVDGETYTTVAQLPIYIPAGFTRLEWSAQGYTPAGSAGSVRLRTLLMAAGEVSAGFGSAWSAGGFNTNRWQDHDDDPHDVKELVVQGQSWDTLIVDLKGGDSGNTYLTGLSVRLKES